MEKLTTKTFHGIKWSSTATIVNLVLQVGYTAVMARLLNPIEFGLVAMAHVFLRFGGYFANMGMAQALIQKPDLSKDDIRAAFSSSVVLGLIFFGILYLSAPLAAHMFKTKDIIPIIKLLSLTFVFSSLSTTSGSLIRRELKFRQFSIIQIAVFVISSAIAIILAILGYGVWSLVYSQLVNSVLYSLLTYWLVRHSLKLLFNWRIYKPLFMFGSRISVINFLEFINSNADSMMIGRYLGPILLGIYNRAFMIIELPVQQLNSSISRVLFPAFSSIQKETERLKKVYLSSSSVIAFIFLSTCAGAAVSAENIVYVVLGENWAAAIPILQILAILVPLKLLSHYGGIVCDATASLNIKIIIETTFLCLLATALYTIRNTSLYHYALVLLGMGFLRFTAYTFTMKKILRFDFQDVKKAYFSPLVTASIVVCSLLITNVVMDRITNNYIIKLLVDMSTGGIILSLSLFLSINKPILDELVLRFFSQVKVFNKIITNYIK